MNTQDIVDNIFGMPSNNTEPESKSLGQEITAEEWAKRTGKPIPGTGQTSKADPKVTATPDIESKPQVEQPGNGGAKAAANGLTADTLNDFMDYVADRKVKAGLLAGSVMGLNAMSGQSLPSNVIDTVISTGVGLEVARRLPGHGKVVGPMAALATTVILDPFLNAIVPKPQPQQQINPYMGGYY